MDIGMRHRRLKTGVSQGFHRAEPQTALHLLLATGLLHWPDRLLILTSFRSLWDYRP